MSPADPSEQWELPRTVRAAREARARVDRHRGTLGEDAWRRARLLVSELATNAVRHGEGRIELTIAVTQGHVRVCVRDEGRHDGGGLERRRPDADGGFGLHLLADLSDRWGEAGRGTSVWFEVDRAEPSR